MTDWPSAPGRAPEGGPVKIEHLREFTTCAREGNVTAAARRLYLSQPALSKHLAALEREVGLTLLDRTTHAVTPTAAGAVALELFERVVDDYDRAMAALDLMRDGYDRQVRLGFLLHSLGNELYQATRAIAASQPGCRASVRFGDADELVAGLAAGAYDACLLLGVAYPCEGLAFRPVGRVPLLALVEEGDPLCELGAVGGEALRGRALVLPRDEMGFATTVEALLAERLGVAGPVTWAPQRSTELFAVRESGGVAVISAVSRKRLPAGARTLPFADAGLALDIGWLHRVPADGAERDALTAFLDDAARILADHGAL